MTDKFYWFYIEPYVHISIKGNGALLYNTLNAQTLEYKGRSKVLALIKELVFKKNLLVTKLTRRNLQDNSIAAFVNKVKKNYFGDIVDAKYSKGKPVQLMPMLKIQKSIEKVKDDPFGSAGENLMRYVTELSLYITNECGQNCSMCKSAYKQFLCCSKMSPADSELGMQKIEQFVHETQASTLLRINILGGNILRYSKLKELSKLLDTREVQKAYYLHYLNIDNSADNLRLFRKRFCELDLLINFPVQQDKLTQALRILTKEGVKPKCIFIVQQEGEVRHVKAIISKFDITDYSFQPYYNGKNLNFFKDNVFINKDEICQAKPTYKDIFSRMAFNPTNWGRVVILNNGDVYANINQPKLGSLGGGSLYDMLYNEMRSGKSWRRLRTNVEPCKRCVFDVLCPPISNYEYALKRNNLCHVWK